MQPCNGMAILSGAPWGLCLKCPMYEPVIAYYVTPALSLPTACNAASRHQRGLSLCGKRVYHRHPISPCCGT